MSEHFIDLSCAGSADRWICWPAAPESASSAGAPAALSSCSLSLEEAAKKLIISEDTFGGDPAQVRIIPPY